MPNPQENPPLLTKRAWQLKYTPDDGNLVGRFYVPALECAKYYSRSTGYFGAEALTLALTGVEGLIRNGGSMRLVVGCTLDEEEVAAIERGEELRAVVERAMATRPLEPPDNVAADALELLAWMIQHGILQVKVAVPCDAERRPMASDGIFHEKAGIIHDVAGNRLAFSGSINETFAGWKKNWESFNVYTSWDHGAAYLAQEEANFAKLWTNTAKRALTLDVPQAVRDDLLRFLPDSDQPARLSAIEEPVGPTEHEAQNRRDRASKRGQSDRRAPFVDPRRQAWAYIRVVTELLFPLPAAHQVTARDHDRLPVPLVPLHRTLIIPCEAR